MENLTNIFIRSAAPCVDWTCKQFYFKSVNQLKADIKFPYNTIKAPHRYAV